MKYFEKIESAVLYFLLALLMFAVCLGSLELGHKLIEKIFQPPYFRLDPIALFEGFGLLLNIVIGLELVKLLKLHLKHNELRPELVIEVAIIAICNKVVTLDLKHLPGETLLGLAALLVALSVGYFVFNKTKREAAKLDN